MTDGWYDAGLASRYRAYHYPYGDTHLREFVRLQDNVVVEQRTIVDECNAEYKVNPHYMGHYLVTLESGNLVLYEPDGVGPTAYLKKIKIPPHYDT